MTKIFKNTKVYYFLTTLLIIFLSLVPRIVESINLNPIFGFDQGREMLAAKNIVVGHKLILIGTAVGAGQAGITGLFHGPLYYYILTIPFMLFHGNPGKIIYLMLFFGLSTILFGYFFGKKIFGIKYGFLLALLLSISPILVAQSRFLWSPNPPPLFILLTLFFTYLFIKSKRGLYIFLASFFAGFIYNFELGISVPLFLSLFIFTIFYFRKDLKMAIFLLPGFILGYLPALLFELRHNFLQTRSVLSYITTSHHVSNSSNNHSLFFYLWEHLVSFISYFTGTFPNVFIQPVVFICLLVISVYFIRKEKDKVLKNFMGFLLLLIPVTYLVFAPLRNTIWNIYLMHLNISYLLLFVYVVYASFRKKIFPLKVVLSIFIVCLVFAGLASAVRTYKHDINDYGGIAKVKGKEDALDYIYKDSKGKPFGLLVFTPPVYTYPYDYLIWWYGKSKYHYVPYNEKKGTFYLLIQKDNDKPWSYQGWLKTVIKSGKVISTTTLHSGFIVQKRTQTE